MMGFIVVILFIIIMIKCVQMISKETTNANAREKIKEMGDGKDNYVVNQIMLAYENARNNIEALNGNIITIMTYCYEYDGKASYNSKFLAVGIVPKDEGQINVQLARSLDFDVEIIEGKTYVQHVVRGDFKKSDKIAFLECVENIIKERYPNDYLQCDINSPHIMSMVDCKDLMSMISN